jgi:hypothetical protein
MFALIISLRAGTIHDATAAGDLNKVRALLEVNPTLLESTDGDGNTPLHRACISKPPSFTPPVAAAGFLLGKGANVNARNHHGFTPLHLASSGRSPDSDLIQRLIARGADVNARLDRGLTSLHWAASSGDNKATTLLIDHGADLNAYDNGCYGTPLRIAINSCVSPFVYAAVFSADGRRAYFTSAGPRLVTAEQSQPDLWFSEREGAEWSEPKSLNLVARYPEAWSARVGSIARNGTLCFMGYTPGPQNDSGRAR